jgi:hypothetical protein
VADPFATGLTPRPHGRKHTEHRLHRRIRPPPPSLNPPRLRALSVGPPSAMVVRAGPCQGRRVASKPSAPSCPSPVTGTGSGPLAAGSAAPSSKHYWPSPCQSSAWTTMTVPSPKHSRICPPPVRHLPALGMTSFVPHAARFVGGHRCVTTCRSCLQGHWGRLAASKSPALLCPSLLACAGSSPPAAGAAVPSHKCHRSSSR